MALRDTPQYFFFKVKILKLFKKTYSFFVINSLPFENNNPQIIADSNLSRNLLDVTNAMGDTCFPFLNSKVVFYDKIIY